MKKQAKILALILSLCLIFGIIVATTAFADTIQKDEHQLNKNTVFNDYGVTKMGFSYDAFNKYDTEGDAYPLSDYMIAHGHNIYSGTGHYRSYLQASDFDTLVSGRSNKYMEFRPYRTGNTNAALVFAPGLSSGALDYYVIDFDMTATQYLIYFKTPYFVDRDGDGEFDKKLNVNTHLGYVSSSTDAAENEAFTHAFGTFEYDKDGNITEIKVDGIFFMEKYDTYYFPRYLNVGEDGNSFKVDATLNTGNSSGSENLYNYKTTITDTAVINNITYHAAYDNGTNICLPIDTGWGGSNAMLMSFDSFENGGRYKFNGNVKTVYFSNEVNVWDHITIIAAYNEYKEIGTTYYYSYCYILMNGELVHKVEKFSGTTAYSTSRIGQLQLNRMSSTSGYNPNNYSVTGSGVPAYSIGYDNWTAHTYENGYNSVNYVGIDDYVRYLETGELPEGMDEISLTDCVDAVYDSDYISPSAYTASVVSGNSTFAYEYFEMDKIAEDVTTGSTLTITKDLLNFVPKDNVRSFSVVTLDGAEFSLADTVVSGGLYAVPNANGSGYSVREMNENDMVDIELWLGDKKLGNSTANIFTGITMGDYDLTYVIVDRENGIYVIPGATQYKWNMDEDGQYDPDNYYDFDLEVLKDEMPYFDEDWTEHGYTLKVQVIPTTAVANGYMVVDYVNGYERVVPNSAGTYDYLFTLDGDTVVPVDYNNAAKLAAAFKTDLKSAANNGKTIVVTAGYLLDFDGDADGDNAESLRGFDLFADTNNSGNIIFPANFELALDLNGRTLVSAWVKGDVKYENTIFTIKNNDKISLYSSIPGGQIFQSHYWHASTENWNSQGPNGYITQQSRAVFTSPGDAYDWELNIGRYVNPDTKAVADGDNLTIAGGSVVYVAKTTDTFAESADIDINIDGGLYYCSTRSIYGMFVISAPNTTLNLNNATVIFNQGNMAVFTFNYSGWSYTNIAVNIDNSIILAKNVSTDAPLKLINSDNANRNKATTTITNSTVIANVHVNDAAGKVIVGENCILSGAQWDNSAHATCKAGIKTAQGPDKTMSFTAPFNFALASQIPYDAGMTETDDIHLYTTDGGATHVVREYQTTTIDGSVYYYMSDNFYEMVEKSLAVTGLIYTFDVNNLPEDIVTLTYKYAEETETLYTDYYVVGSVVAHPDKITVEKTGNGWYNLGATPDSWSVANGTVITENLTATADAAKLVPTVAIDAKYSVNSSTNIVFNLYLPIYKTPNGASVPLPEGVTLNRVYKYKDSNGVYSQEVYNPTDDSKNTYIQVAADGTKMIKFEANQVQTSQFNTHFSFYIFYTVVYEGETYELFYQYDLKAVDYVEAVLEQRKNAENGKKDIIWAYSYLNYLNTTYKSNFARTIDGAEALLARYLEECPYIAEKLTAYEQELETAVANTKLDYSALDANDAVLGFAWDYNIGRPSLVIYLDASKTSAVAQTKKAGVIYSVKVSGWTNANDVKLTDKIENPTTDGSHYYRGWNRINLDHDNDSTTAAVSAIWVCNAAIKLSGFLKDQHIEIYAYDENGNATTTPIAEGDYSVAEFIKWVRGTTIKEGVEVPNGTAEDIAAAESLYMLALAQRDFQVYVPENQSGN